MVIKLKLFLKRFPIIFFIARLSRNLLILYPKWILFKIAKNWVILNRINPKIIVWLWKVVGVNVKGNFFISYDVSFDVNNAKLITIEEDVLISPKVSLICHKRDLNNYFINDRVNEQPFMFGEIILKKGCSIGTGSIIFPNVIIGEGSIIGAGSVVTKSIPDWSIAVGNPAKVIKTISKRDE